MSWRTRVALRPLIESGASVMDSVLPLSVYDTNEDIADGDEDDNDAA